jgi:RNA polymerase sigma-70 factor (ECF subfamily)
VSDSPDPAETLERRDSLEPVHHAFETLDLEHRHAFILYEIEGKSCSAIAAASGVPVGTVYSRLHHARQRLIAAYAAPTVG